MVSLVLIPNHLGTLWNRLVINNFANILQDLCHIVQLLIASAV